MAWSDCAAFATPPRLVLLQVASKDRHSSYALSSVVRLALRFVLFHHLTLLARSGFVRSSTPASTLTILAALQFRPHRPTDRPVGWLTGCAVAHVLQCWHSTHISSRPASSAQRSLEYTYDTCTCERSSVRRAEPGRAPVNCSFCCCSER